MADISNVVSVSIVPSGRTVSRTNMNIVGLVTGNVGVLNSANRTRVYTHLKGVAEDFGTTSIEYIHASVLFAQSKNPCNSGGYLVMGYWRKFDEVVPASSGYLLSGKLNENELIKNLQQINDGKFTISVDGTAQDVGSLDFRAVDTLDEIKSILSDAITGVTVDIVNDAIKITSNTTGATSTVSYLIDNDSAGTFVGDILKLTAGSGVAFYLGEDEKTLAAESLIDGLTEISKNEAIRGVTSLGRVDDGTVPLVDILDLISYLKANDIIYYDTNDDIVDINTISNPDSMAIKIKLAGGDNFRPIFSKKVNRRIATAYMSRMHTVNFNAENSAITMNLKELTGIEPSDYTDNELHTLKKVGLDCYTTLGGIPKLLTSGANDFTDNVYNFIAIKKYIQIDLFNLLGTTTTKLAQTDGDVAKIIATVENTLNLFVKAKAIAPGTWTSSDTFGNEAVFKRAIETNGYYVYAKPLSEQAQSDREERKSPVIQVAFKNAGAIHSVDTIINYNL